MGTAEGGNEKVGKVVYGQDGVPALRVAYDGHGTCTLADGRFELYDSMWVDPDADRDPNAPAAGNTKSGNTNSKPQSENANNRPLVRVSALRAASPPEAPIWDRIEVDVQPFDLRIERDMYDRLIAYIFPEKNGDAGEFIFLFLFPYWRLD